MKRREFSASLLATGFASSALGLAGSASAQGGPPVEGQQYVKLGQPLPVPAGGKIEVLEFFWYACPHCNAFEPSLEAWAKNVPADVAFRRVPVAFRPEPFVAHQQIYYALEQLGVLPAMHRKVFAAIHVEQQRLDKLPDIAAFMGKNGVDAAKFTEAFNSFGVQTKARQAKQLSEAYRIDGVPALGIQGRFYTSVSLAGGPERALAVTDYLVDRVRKKA